MPQNNQLTNTVSKYQAQKALVNILLKQFDTLTEKSFNEYYDEISKKHTDVIVDTLRNNNGAIDGVVVKELKRRRNTIDLQENVQAKLEKTYQYFCQNVSPECKGEFDKWYRLKISNDLLDNIGNMHITEVSYDEIYDKLEELADQFAKDPKYNSNWEKDKKRINNSLKSLLQAPKLDYKDIYNEIQSYTYIHKKTKEKLNTWIKQRAALCLIRANVSSSFEKLCQKHSLGWGLKRSLNKIIESGFDQNLIDQLDLSKYSKEIEQAIANFLVTSIETATTNVNAINKDDYINEATKNPDDANVFIEKIKSIADEDYKNKREDVISTEEKIVQEKLEKFVEGQKKARAEFKDNIANKNADQLLNILAKTTKQIDFIHDAIEILNNASDADDKVKALATYKEISGGFSIATQEKLKEFLKSNERKEISRKRIGDQINNNNSLKSYFETRKHSSNNTQINVDQLIYNYLDEQSNVKIFYAKLRELLEGQAQPSLIAISKPTDETSSDEDIITGPMGVSQFSIDEARKILNNASDDDTLKAPEIFNKIYKNLSTASKNKLTTWLDFSKNPPSVKRDVLNYPSDVKTLYAKLKELLEEEERAINNSVLGKARQEYKKYKVQKGWVKRAYEHAQGFSVACALTMAGSVILLVLGILLFTVPFGLIIITPIVLLGVYLGNWWITKHDVAELFLTIFTDPNKHWLRQFLEEGRKNTFSFICSNLSAFMSALFTGVAAYTLVAVFLGIFITATWPIWVIGGIVGAISFYYTYPTYFAISHIFLRIASFGTLTEHLNEIEKTAIINDKLGVHKWYLVYLFLAMLAVLGVMLAAAPFLFVGGLFIGLPLIAVQIIGYGLITLSFFGIGTFYAFRTKFAAIKVMNHDGIVPFNGMKEKTLCELRNEMSLPKRLLLMNMVDKINNQFLVGVVGSQLAMKLKALIEHELDPITFPNKPLDLTANEIDQLKADQTTLGKLYRIYDKRENAQEALTLWDKNFEKIRWINAVSNAGPSVFGLILGLSSLGIPPIALGGLGLAGFVGGTGASWAANANGIEKDYSVEAELYAAKSHLQDCMTVSWYANLKSLERALAQYEEIITYEIKHPNIYSFEGHCSKTDKLKVCQKLYLMTQEIKEYGITSQRLSATEKAIAKNGRLGKIYKEMGKHVVRAVDWKNTLMDDDTTKFDKNSAAYKIKESIEKQTKKQIGMFKSVLSEYKTSVENSFFYSQGKRNFIKNLIDKVLRNINKPGEIFDKDEISEIQSGELKSIFENNLNEAERAQVTNQTSVVGYLKNIEASLDAYITKRKEGGEYTRSKSNLYSWFHTINWGTKTRGEKLFVADKLKQSTIQMYNYGYTDVTFDETEKEILRDGNLGEIYKQTKPLLNALYLPKLTS